jgi:hypothetical protein
MMCWFIEHEITGDVLLELDISILKEELEITAFGKRMRIANAIVELRRPASFSSDPHTSLNGTGSMGGVAPSTNGFVGNGGGSGPATVTGGDGAGSAYPNGSRRLDGMSIVSEGNEGLKVPVRIQLVCRAIGSCLRFIVEITSCTTSIVVAK